MKHIPNFFTSLNLFCGCLAIVFSFSGYLEWAAAMIGLAAIFDFLDGMFARLLMVQSEIGKQLDSLADMVTFGVTPGVILFEMFNRALLGNYPELPFFAFVITVFSAIRLAKFNLDTRQTNSFIGVPTPANAILVASFPLIMQFQAHWAGIEWTSIFLNIGFLIIFTVLMSYLLIAELPLFALKFKDFSFKNNSLRYIFLGISVLLLITCQFVGIPIILILYLILSIINNKKLKTDEI
ncbi:MAG TPA: CDP-diacylglycerol--serine O-phosphatidyltransferase [Bacteroidia bacterium]|nr:CDP-diacylglycerol--serine O-phosphatidyltransferase [Bacteroidia bacterium]